ncbi:MAG: NAD(P)/FAD-dependent oxidoreductase, partial [Alphaproteobacteria bacterium]|nr:NAD(P)/FAD-dependent oxidoreductase [Alphaproteobacteria bacterium]
MSERIDCAVIGAGAVGLAVARRLARAGREVVVLEAEEGYGTGISSRNSEVIHAGIYYAKDSLKARLCVRGKRLLYDFCARHGVPHARTTKLIVATAEGQLPALGRLKDTAAANGVDDLVRLTAQDARVLEPELSCVAALLSPSTGIVDSHGLMTALLGEAEARGAVLATHAPVAGGRIGNDGIELAVVGPHAMRLKARTVVNAAGLGANAVARGLAGFPPARVPGLHYAKGSYFTLAGVAPPFKRLVYPMPVDAWLGIHVTVDLGGQVRFGPDIEFVDGLDFDVDPRRAAPLYRAVRSYWPALPDGALQAGYAGIRPRLVPQGVPAPDLVVEGPETHGIAGLVNLFGI